MAPRPANAKLKEDALYLVAGGFGGLGRIIVQWLATRGARKIVIISRSPVNLDKQDFIDDMRIRHGVVILARTCDIAKQEEVESMLAGLASQGPVSGLIQSTMILQVSAAKLDLIARQLNRRSEI